MLKKRKNEKKDDGALFIPAGVLSGIGFGFLYHNLLAGLFIGLGFGFFIFAIVEIFLKSKK